MIIQIGPKVSYIQTKPASQFVEWYHSIVSYVLNMEDIILKNYTNSVK
jgi:hypothetical protein